MRFFNRLLVKLALTLRAVYQSRGKALPLNRRRLSQTILRPHISVSALKIRLTMAPKITDSLIIVRQSKLLLCD